MVQNLINKVIFTVHNQQKNNKLTLKMNRLNKNNKNIKKVLINIRILNKMKVNSIIHIVAKELMITLSLNQRKRSSFFTNTLKTIPTHTNNNRTTGLNSNKIVTRFNLMKKDAMNEHKSMDNTNLKKILISMKRIEVILKRI